MLPPWVCHCGQHNAGAGPCSRCLNPAPDGVWSPAVPAPPAPWRPGPAIVALAVTIAVLLIAGAAGVTVVAGGGRGSDVPARSVLVAPTGPAPAPPGEAGPDQPAQAPSDLERELPELMRFVEQARGLPFTRAVKVTLLGDSEFRRRLLGADHPRGPEDKAELAATERVLQALGLLDRGVDLEAAIDSLFGSAVVGFYDTEADDLVVRGDKITPGRRATLVHELTHALQDQHFDIERSHLDERDDESATGLTGLVEGDAVRVERQYVESLPSRQQKAIDAEEAEFAGAIDPSTPPVLLHLVGFPYLVGPEFVSELLAHGGQATVDAAFASPPTTSEQLLHPDRFLAGDGPKEVAAPAADSKVIDEGVLGELGLLLFLRQALGPSAQTASQGWGGDRYVAWGDGRRACVRANIVMDTPDDDTRLLDALGRVAQRRKGVSVRGRGPITLTSCR